METWLAAMLIWLALVWLKPARRDQKGYVWTVLKKVPPWRWIRETGDLFDGITRRYPRWLIVMVGLYLLLPFDLLYVVLAALELDDWMNGDDDERKRRWESVKNKVKWLMELPAPPQEVKVGGR